MTGIMKSNFKHSELTGTHSGVRMKFWGVCCVGGKAYKQVVNYRFHLTMAVLDPKSFDRDIRDRTVTLSVIQHGQVFLLCVLKHGEIQQVSLNLIFDKGDDVTFSVGGYGTVHLTGYQLIDSDSALDMDNEHYCPVAELGSEKLLRNRSILPVNGVETKNREKAKFTKAMIGDSEDDEDDSDFSLKMQEIEDSCEEDSEEYDDEDDDIEIDEEEVKDVLQDVNDMETPKSEGCQKRKSGKMSQSKKRMKKENSEFLANRNVSLEDDGSNPDEGGLNCSIGNTPMPKNLDASAKSKKKFKKSKRLSEISTLDQSVDDSLSFSTGKSINSKNNEGKFPIVKVEGGLEYQDVQIGRGPPITNGKILSVFYMGRLSNKTIFDARVPPNKPFSFKLGVPEVIKGLDIGMKGMKVGGQRKLKIPPHMGYGSKGVKCVPPNSTLFFTVEIISAT